jgi:hypothetical protein
LKDAGIDTSTFAAHSTRSAAASKAASAGIPVQAILDYTILGYFSNIQNRRRSDIMVTVKGRVEKRSGRARVQKMVGRAPFSDTITVTIATSESLTLSPVSLLYYIWCQKKETNPSPKADIIIASKNSAWPYESSVFSFPLSW